MKNFQAITCLAFIFLVSSCENRPETAQQIIDKTIEVYGGQKVYKSDIEFDFRDIHYRAYYSDGLMSYEREINDDSLGFVHDVLNNEGFTRTVNEAIIDVDEEWTGKYTRSVNSVIYFFRIPFNLNDQAVNKKRLEDTEIEGKEYFQVSVYFNEEGGGEDFDDSFLYWINKDNFHIDYLAYSYATDGGGKRFRKAINTRTVDGLLTSDWINYKPESKEIPLNDLEQLFKEGKLEELSRIENVNIEVNYLQ